MPVDIDVINKMILLSVFLLGLVLGSAISVFTQDLFKRRRE